MLLSLVPPESKGYHLHWIRRTAPRFVAAIGFTVSRSEQELQCKLNLTGPVDLRTDHAEVGCPDLASGVTETRAVEGIEELRAKLNIEPSVLPEPVVFEESGVPVVDAVNAHVRRGPGGIAE